MCPLRRLLCGMFQVSLNTKHGADLLETSFAVYQASPAEYLQSTNSKSSNFSSNLRTIRIFCDKLFGFPFKKNSVRNKPITYHNYGSIIFN